MNTKEDFATALNLSEVIIDVALYDSVFIFMLALRQSLMRRACALTR